MSAQVLKFPGAQAHQAAPIPKVKKPFPFLHEILFVRNLCVWMICGGLLSLVLPTSLIMLGCVIALYIESKRRI